MPCLPSSRVSAASRRYTSIRLPSVVVVHGGTTKSRALIPESPHSRVSVMRQWHCLLGSGSFLLGRALPHFWLGKAQDTKIAQKPQNRLQSCGADALWGRPLLSGISPTAALRDFLGRHRAYPDIIADTNSQNDARSGLPIARGLGKLETASFLRSNGTVRTWPVCPVSPPTNSVLLPASGTTPVPDRLHRGRDRLLQKFIHLAEQTPASDALKHRYHAGFR